MEEISLKQKSRALWLKDEDEDENSKFFHWMANARRRINYISKIKRGCRVLHEAEIKEEIACFFLKTYIRRKILLDWIWMVSIFL